MSCWIMFDADNYIVDKGTRKAVDQVWHDQAPMIGENSLKWIKIGLI